MGALGGVAATFPLSALLGALGWTGTFLLLGAVTAGYAAVTAGVVRDVPGTTAGAGDARAVLRKIRSSWAVPGTRLAFWVHFGTMFVPNALSLLWGYPYLVDGLGVPPETAGVVLSVLIAGQIAGGSIAPGEEVLHLPSGMRTRVTAVDTADGELERGRAPQSVTLRLADDIDVGRGDVLCAPDRPAPAAEELTAAVCWMS